MIIAVFGASGKVGRLVVDELLARGHEIRAFVHKTPLENKEGLTICRGDIRNQEDVLGTVTGADAVVSTLSSWHAKEKNVLSTAMSRIIPAMDTALVKRIVTLTGDLALAPSDSPSLFRWFTHSLLNFGAPKVLRDAEDHITLLANSELDWTVVRSPVMTKKTVNTYLLRTTRASLTIPRLAVATALTDLVESDEWNKSAPFIAVSP